MVSKYIYYSCTGGRGNCEQQHIYISEKKIEEQAKILKIVKGLNKFTLPDILPILNKSKKVISNLLSKLEAENLIKKDSET